ncbi:hypotheical protein [Halarchaeum acidiphilum MH1-52-1]|uniref:Hypotheical protein n=1 Tax=Halarchaeum acidiphilum MH1-52-1 TaxID=1261545 RepID=U2YTE1_9EURY|nr:hypotheical protein [Halarchaeum acidiphilum MH1-52-1]
MSISIESAATARDGVTLVTAIVRNESDADRRVRIENELDGVVRPPRLDGVAADGWDVDGFEGVVAKRGTLALGYACGGAPSAEPCRVAWTENPGRVRARRRSRTRCATSLTRDRPPPASHTREGTRRRSRPR